MMAGRTARGARRSAYCALGACRGARTPPALPFQGAGGSGTGCAARAMQHLRAPSMAGAPSALHPAPPGLALDARRFADSMEMKVRKQAKQQAQQHQGASGLALRVRGRAARGSGTGVRRASALDEPAQQAVHCCCC